MRKEELENFSMLIRRLNA